MNVNDFSIVALVKVEGFYSGTCQANMLLKRGPEHSTGGYTLLMTDNPWDGNNCMAFDSTKFVWGGAGPDCIQSSSWQTTSTVQSFQWHRVAATYNGSVYKIFINGQLVTTIPVNGCSMGYSTDSIIIGRNYDNFFNYPYWFNGTLDQLELYNRALDDTEVTSSGCTRFIAMQPQDSATMPGNNVTFTTGISTGGQYQWQVNIGTGFTNISNVSSYGGINTPILTVIAPTLSMDGYSYRCIVVNSIGCTDTSMPAVLNVDALGVEGIAKDDETRIYPVPAHNELNVVATVAIASIEMTDVLGKTVFEATGNGSNQITLHLELPGGIYFANVRDRQHRLIARRKISIH